MKRALLILAFALAIAAIVLPRSQPAQAGISGVVLVSETVPVAAHSQEERTLFCPQGKIVLTAGFLGGGDRTYVDNFQPAYNSTTQSSTSWSFRFVNNGNASVSMLADLLCANPL